MSLGPRLAPSTVLEEELTVADAPALGSLFDAVFTAFLASWRSKDLSRESDLSLRSGERPRRAKEGVADEADFRVVTTDRNPPHSPRTSLCDCRERWTSTSIRRWAVA